MGDSRFLDPLPLAPHGNVPLLLDYITYPEGFWGPWPGRPGTPTSGQGFCFNVQYSGGGQVQATLSLRILSVGVVIHPTGAPWPPTEPPNPYEGRKTAYNLSLEQTIFGATRSAQTGSQIVMSDDGEVTTYSTGMIAGTSPSIHRLSNHSLLLAQANSFGGVSFFRSLNDGEEWSLYTVTGIPTPAYYPSLWESHKDAASPVWLSWHTKQGEDGDVKVARSFDGGLTFGTASTIAVDVPPQKVDLRGDVSTLIAAVEEKNGVISFYHSYDCGKTWTKTNGGN
jgi:hypothetical protein